MVKQQQQQQQRVRSFFVDAQSEQSERTSCREELVDCCSTAAAAAVAHLLFFAHNLSVCVCFCRAGGAWLATCLQMRLGRFVERALFIVVRCSCCWLKVSETESKILFTATTTTQTQTQSGEKTHNSTSLLHSAAVKLIFCLREKSEWKWEGIKREKEKKFSDESKSN